MRDEDPLAEARLRGVMEQRRLLDEAGGAVGATEAAKMLGVPLQAVDSQRKRGVLLAVATGRHGWHYPRCQLDAGSKDGVVRGLSRVIAAVKDASGWMVLVFLLSPEERLRDRRPLDALRTGEIDAVARVASAYGEHIAR